MKNLKKVYVLYYVYEFEDGHDDVRTLGVFSTREKAKEALSKIKKIPEFKRKYKLFSIYKSTLDLLGWSEGYIIID